MFLVLQPSAHQRAWRQSPLATESRRGTSEAAGASCPVHTWPLLWSDGSQRFLGKVPCRGRRMVGEEGHSITPRSQPRGPCGQLPSERVVRTGGPGRAPWKVGGMPRGHEVKRSGQEVDVGG